MPALSASSLEQDCSLARRLLFPYTLDTRSFAGSFAICFLIAAFLAFAPRHVLRRFLRLGLVEPTSPSHMSKSLAAKQVLVEEVNDDESESDTDEKPISQSCEVVAEKVEVQSCAPTVSEPVVQNVMVESVSVVAPTVESVQSTPSIVAEPVVESIRVKSFAEVAAVAVPKSKIAPPPGFASKAVAPIAPIAPVASAAPAAPVDWHSSSRSVLKLSKKSEPVAVVALPAVGTVTYARGPDGSRGFALARRSVQ
jgi:hypothetical protein